MTHLTDLECSMYVDNALPDAAAEVVAQHIESCDLCSDAIRASIDEKQLIEASLSVDDAVVVPNVVPRFTKSLSLRDFAVANVLTGTVVWLAQFLWKTLFGELIVNALTRITSIYIPDVYELVVSTALYFFQEGTTMIDTYLGSIVPILLILAAAWFAFLYRKTRASISFCMLVAMGGGLLMPPSANALELRRSDDMVTIAAGETIDDTLIVAADTIVVDGNINGDLIAFARRIVLNGSVDGNLVTFAEDVTIRGQVGGFSLGAASSYELSDAVVKGDVWAAGEKVSISGDSRVGGNASIFSETTSIEGYIHRDLFVFGENIELSGEVGEDLEAFSNRVNLLGEASIGGDLRFRTGDENKLQRSAAATVGGKVEFLSMPARLKSRYVSGEFYVLQLVRLVSAFLAGIVLLWFVPDLRYASLGGGIDGIKTAGIGLIALISLPVILVLFAITIVGLPFTMIGLVSWLLAIYFAKIVVASVIGQMLLSSTDKEDSLPLTLLSGLVVIIVAVNIPAIGGVISFILTIIGIGILVQLTLEYVSSLDANEAIE